ncbi:hypothetical protein ACQ5SA_05525 [Stenotrophomonas indicatrix]|uniref:hypothetical protein n=1 Tax=Stenotrophomonas lactitubi TaxID=2045214 RepID=UPI00333E1E88
MRYPQWLATGALLAGLLVSSTSLAQDPAAPDPTQDKLMITAGFLNGHPDLRFRLLALEKYKAGKRADALRFFQYASQYADKPSQAMVAEMLWNGDGTTQDRALAYAWMDLAAERGYGGFLELRERYWNQLAPEERERALNEGEAIYARYGDAAAQPRIATVLRRERRAATGSRTGFTGNLRIIVPGPAGPQEIDGSKFYDERYWDPERYQAWHDSVWKKPRIASVDVGDVQQLQKDAKGSRIPEVKPLQDVPEPDAGNEMPTLQDGPVKP